MTDEPAGIVYLVGAGPGDPGLITARGIECLRQADVVLYDYLVNPLLASYAPPTAQCVCLGKHGRSRIWTQDEINQRMVELARQGKRVVRLKGGDPAVFARGADETDYLRQHNVTYQIVPGITVALAAGSHAGIPITHRDCASAVALVTGRESDSKQGDPLDYDGLARFPGTLVIYMGVTTARQWSHGLIAAGKDPKTPAAIIQRCSLTDQKVIECLLEDIPQYLNRERKIQPPVIVIIGRVVSHRDTLNWFQRQPLIGQQILVTRPHAQSLELDQKLRQLGAGVVIAPAIEIGPPDDWTPVDQAIAKIEDFHWIVFSSSNGVRAFLDRLWQQGRDARSLATASLASIGPGTAATLSQYHLRADLLPETYRAESLAAMLEDDVRGKQILLIRASRGREVLAESLTAAGGHVQQVVVYGSRDVARADPEVVQQLERGKIQWATVTSSAIAQSMHSLYGDLLRKVRLVSMSPVTTATLRPLGFEPAAEATEYTMDGLIQAIVEVVGTK